MTFTLEPNYIVSCFTTEKDGNHLVVFLSKPSTRYDYISYNYFNTDLIPSVTPKSDHNSKFILEVIPIGRIIMDTLESKIC